MKIEKETIKIPYVSKNCSDIIETISAIDEFKTRIILGHIEPVGKLSIIVEEKLSEKGEGE